MPFADTQTGAHLHYVDWPPTPQAMPQPEPVLAIHGWMGSAEADLGRVMRVLNAAGYRVIGPTRRGYGESGPKPRDYPFDFYHRDARDLLALLDALDIRRAHVIGYSDGGETALVMAGLAPERLASCAAWGAVGWFDASLRERIQRSYPADWVDDETLARNGWDRAAADRIVLGWINAVRVMIDKGGDISLSMADRMTMPLLLMLGDQDTLNPEFAGRRFVGAAPHGNMTRRPCGHAIHDLLPDAFDRTLLAFLDDVRHSQRGHTLAGT
jgi:valacyclovir hydrolase